MSRPGDRLRSFAARWCCAETMERIVDPLVADLQHEHARAVKEGRILRSRAIHVAGWIAFFKVVTICVWRDDLAPRNWTSDDRRILVKALACSVALVVVVTALLEIPPLKVYRAMNTRGASAWFVILTLVPQALAIAMTFGLTLGIVCGIGGRALSRRVGGAVVVLALVASALSFANLSWILPAANRAFRVSVVGRLDLAKGPPELTLGELRQAIETGERPVQLQPRFFDHSTRYLRSVQLQYHDRWALSLSPIVSTLLILSIAAGGHLRRWVLGIAAVAAFLGFYVLTYAGRPAVFAGTMPAYVSAWAPNMTFALVTVLLTLRKYHASVRDEPAR